jgi:hypothetical protein
MRLYLFFKNLKLNVRRRKISVEVEPALADGDTLDVRRDVAQARERRRVPRLGVVRMNTCNTMI